MTKAKMIQEIKEYMEDIAWVMEQIEMAKMGTDLNNQTPFLERKLKTLIDETYYAMAGLMICDTLTPIEFTVILKASMAIGHTLSQADLAYLASKLPPYGKTTYTK